MYDWIQLKKDALIFYFCKYQNIQKIHINLNVKIDGDQSREAENWEDF
jgi:hypothetical protein